MTFISQNVVAADYVCSYPGYLNSKKPVIIKVSIKGETADVDGYRYKVLEDTSSGLVLARSFANFNPSTNKADFGLFGIVIRKKDLEFTRGNILDSSEENSVVKGKCIKSK